MKKSSIVLALLALTFGLLVWYFRYEASGGADGLGNFIPLVFCGVLLVATLLAFFISLIPRKKGSITRKWLIGLIVALPLIGFLSVIGVFGYFTFDYQQQYAAEVELHKSVLKTVEFKDEVFGIAFNHVSGDVSTYENGKPIPTSITPRIEDGKLVVPADDETYLSPDILLNWQEGTDKDVSQFLEGLKKKLNLSDSRFTKVSSKLFSRLPKETQIWVAKNPQVPYQERLKLVRYFLPERTGFPDLIYFISLPERPKEIWVLIISGTTYSAPAFVEKLSTTNFEDENLWFHTLEFLR